MAEFLGLCQCAGGGFGGGPGQLAHLAPTYAAVAALAELGGPGALGAVDRAAAARFLAARCVPPARGGGFSLCEGARPRSGLRVCGELLAMRGCMIKGSGLADALKIHYLLPDTCILQAFATATAEQATDLSQLASVSLQHAASSCESLWEIEQQQPQRDVVR